MRQDDALEAHKKPADTPSNPNQICAEAGWVGMGEGWLANVCFWPIADMLLAPTNV
jgi:hypothetical protein